MTNDSDIFLSRRDIGNQFEVLLSLVYRTFVKPGDVVIDGGSNSGLHSIPLAHIVGKKGAVYAYEPQRNRLKELKKWAISDCVNDVIITRPVALSNRYKYSVFWKNLDNNALSSLLKPITINKDVWERKIVKVVRLDNEYLQLPVSFIKLDLEGSEFRALQGAKKLLTIYKPLVAFESSCEWAAILGNYTSHQFFDFFSNIGYTLVDFFGNTFTQKDWTSGKKAWYFFAIDSADPRTGQFKRIISDFWGKLKLDSYLDEWTDVVFLVSGK